MKPITSDVVFLVCLQELKERLELLQDELLCRVCMDCDIDTAFCPCGHLACCSGCAARLDACPLCRSAISQTQRIFLPRLRVGGPAEEEEETETASVAAMSTSSAAFASSVEGDVDDVTMLTTSQEHLATSELEEVMAT